MKKNQLVILFTCMMVFSHSFLQAQNLEYPKFTVPVYRQAVDQRYSDHKIIFYATTIDDKLAKTCCP